MKKIKIITIMLVLLAVPAASTFIAYPYVTGAKYDCYNMCERIALTDDGRVYIVYEENGIQEIIQLDSGGSVINMHSDIKIPFESDIKNGSGVFNCDGTIFRVESVVDGTTGNTLRQVIYKLADDLSQTIFYIYQNGADTEIKYLTASEGKLFVALLDTSGQSAFVDTFDLNGETPEAPDGRIEFSCPFNDRFYEALYINGSLYASTMSGEVLRCFEGEAINVLKNSAHGGVPYGVIEALGSDGRGVFFYDAMDGFYYYIDASAKLKRQENPVAGYGEHTYAMAEAGPYKLALITQEKSDIMRIALNGGTTAEITHLQPALKDIVKTLARYIALYSAAGFAAVLFVFTIIKAIIKSQRLITKFLFIVTPLIMLAFAGFGFLQNIQLQKMLLNDKNSLSQHYNHLVANSISYGELENITNPQVYKTPEYRRMQDKLRADPFSESGSSSVKNDVFIVRDGELLTGVSLSYPCLVFAKDLITADKLARFDECESLGRPVTFTGLSMSGSWSITISGIEDNSDYSGELKAYVMTWVPQSDIAGILNANSTNFARLALIIILPLIIFLAVIFRIALRPISNLRNAVREVLAGNYEVKLDTATKDEFMSINLAFNKMCSDLKTQMYKLERISDSYYRFVPRNILPVLDKKSILEVNYGDSQRLSVCCCALYMHNLSEMQSAGTDEDFLEYMGVIGNFINNSIKRCGGVLMSPEINLRGLLAIFPSSAENCRDFALDMRQFCLMECSKFGKVSPMITAILHRAGMLYGITGVSDAAFPFLLSDGIDFIMRTLPLFETAQAHIVITQDILTELEDKRVIEIGWRETAKGGGCKLYIPVDVKSEVDEKFSSGLECFYEKDFYTARALFSSVWRNKPASGIAQWYALAADKYLSYPNQFVSSELFGTDVYRIDF